MTSNEAMAAMRVLGERIYGVGARTTVDGVNWQLESMVFVVCRDVRRDVRIVDDTMYLAVLGQLESKL